MAGPVDKNPAATFHMDSVEDTEHTFTYHLPPYQIYQFQKLLKYSEKKWEVPFSFNDGNLSGVENYFTLNLQCKRNLLSCSLNYKIKRIPWTVNKKYDSITLKKKAGIYVGGYGNKKGLSRNKKGGFVSGVSNTETAYKRTKWSTNEITVTIYVGKRPEGSVASPLVAPPNILPPLETRDPRIAKLFLDEKYSDYKLVAGDKAFPAHSFVLGELLIGQFKDRASNMHKHKSALLFWKFASGFWDRLPSSKNQTKVLKIDGFKPEVVKEFLEFVYTGASECLRLEMQNADILQDLCRMAYMFKVVPLQIQAEGYLKNLVNDRNALSIYRLGFEHNSENLMVAAKNRFNRIKAQILPDGKAFKELCKHYPHDMIYKLLLD